MQSGNSNKSKVKLYSTREIVFVMMMRQSITCFECHFSWAVWSIIQVVSDLSQPCSTFNMLGTWLGGVMKELQTLIS